MLVVCVAVGWKLERVRKQREAVAWVHERVPAGMVHYDFDIDDFRFFVERWVFVHKGT